MLKIIACLTMLIDHLGYTFFPEQLWLRAIGRIAFPLFAWYLAVGHRRTGKPWRYIGRVAVWALLSQIPFALLFHGAVLSVPSSFLEGTNVLFTFLFALFGLQLLAVCRKRHWALLIPAWAAVAGLGWLAQLLNTDYGFYGVAMVAVFSVFDRQEQQAMALKNRETEEGSLDSFFPNVGVWRFLLLLSVFLLTLLFVFRMGMHPVQLLCVLAIPLTWLNLPDPKPGRWKYAFYAFYPVHILLIWLISRIPTL